MAFILASLYSGDISYPEKFINGINGNLKWSNLSLVVFSTEKKRSMHSLTKSIAFEYTYGMHSLSFSIICSAACCII